MRRKTAMPSPSIIRARPPSPTNGRELPVWGSSAGGAAGLGAGALITVFGELGEPQDRGHPGVLDLAVGLQQIHLELLFLGPVPEHAAEADRLPGLVFALARRSLDEEHGIPALQLDVERLDGPAGAPALLECFKQLAVAFRGQELTHVPAGQFRL